MGGDLSIRLCLGTRWVDRARRIMPKARRAGIRDPCLRGAAGALIYSGNVARKVARWCMRLDAGPGASDIAELIPEIRERLRALPPVEGARARFRLFDSVTAFLKRASTHRPIVLVLDDLHWADEASLRLVRFLAGAVRDAHLLVVGTYRDVEVHRNHPLAELLPILARESACDRIALRGLDLKDTEASRISTCRRGCARPPPARRKPGPRSGGCGR